MMLMMSMWSWQLTIIFAGVICVISLMNVLVILKGIENEDSVILYSPLYHAKPVWLNWSLKCINYTTV